MRPLVMALVKGIGAGLIFAALMKAFGSPGIGSGVAFGAFVAWMSYRASQGKRDIPAMAMLVMGALGLVVWTTVLVVAGLPENPGDWLWLMVIFAFPIGLLIMGWRKRRAELRSL